MATKTKTSKLLSALGKGTQMTATQLRSRCGFKSVNSLTGTISQLNDRGYFIRSVYEAGRPVKYQMQHG